VGKRKNKIPKKKKKAPKWKPVSKPGDEHMPECTTVGCNRRVSDSRRGQCGRCQSGKTKVISLIDRDVENYWGDYYGAMGGF
jgi:hypothetical protein